MIHCISSTVILTGQAASGKTTALNTAALALNALPNLRSKVNIHRVYPGAFDDLSTLIGRFSSAGAWEDGVCVSLLRKGLKVSCMQVSFVDLDWGCGPLCTIT